MFSNIYIQGSPRTGSTLLYQVLIQITKDTLYISNECNDVYSSRPIFYFQKKKESLIENKKNIDYKNDYGKTKGFLGPSEGSAVMMNWFGGGHPSESVSSEFLDGKKSEFIAFHRFIQENLQLKLITKNAWNCFRIPAIVSTNLPIYFVIVRRNLVDCALSDLDSRYNQGNPNDVWNSASPKNYEVLKKQPYWVQVVEQQYEYNNTMLLELNRLKANYIEIWYEDLCRDPKKVIHQIVFKAGLELNSNIKLIPQEYTSFKKYKYLTEEDKNSVINYIKKNKKRLSEIYKYIGDEAI